jgi:transcriptional regulator with XRE-family HTH domain
VAQSIGERVKTLRAERKRTLAALAQRVGVSTSYLSQVERDKTTPSLATLTALAAALDVQVRYFFETTTEAAFVFRASDKMRDGNGTTPAGRAAAAQEVTEQQLAPPGRSRLVVTHLQIPPGQASGNLSAWPGEEFVFVLSGVIHIDLGGESYSLAAGDSLHFDAAQPHAWRNDSQESCSVLWGSASGP